MGPSRNTPFKWYKQNTHEGGVHVPLVVHWPEGLGDVGGELRHQFHHVNDIAPTIYEACGVTPKDTYGGREQMPISALARLHVHRHRRAEPQGGPVLRDGRPPGHLA